MVDLLRDGRPVDHGPNVETVRQEVFATAERLESELGPEQFAYDVECQCEIGASPEPRPPVTVGLGGGYIRARERRPGGSLIPKSGGSNHAKSRIEVIAGKSIPQEGVAKVLAGVRRVDTKPARRLHEVLQSQGVLPRVATALRHGSSVMPPLPATLEVQGGHTWRHPHSHYGHFTPSDNGVACERCVVMFWVGISDLNAR